MEWIVSKNSHQNSPVIIYRVFYPKLPRDRLLAFGVGYMSTLPTGTVTFLFTDIEGSTMLAQQFPAELPTLL